MEEAYLVNAGVKPSRARKMRGIHLDPEAAMFTANFSAQRYQFQCFREQIKQPSMLPALRLSLG